MDKKQVIAARLAEWGLTVSEPELAQLVGVARTFIDVDTPGLATQF